MKETLHDGCAAGPHRDYVSAPWDTSTADTRTLRTRSAAASAFPTLLWCFTLLLAAAVRVCDSECEFPIEWRGDWFQKGFSEPIRIDRNNISIKGVCKESVDNKFLVQDQKGCLRCISIGAKHTNVLQYKETSFFCGASSREEVCREFAGDAQLFSLFRTNGTPMECPFGGPLSFHYNQGGKECRNPVSTLEACTDTARLLLRFQACADVYGSESREEKLTCLGSWREGSTRYLVGKLDHRTAKTDEDKFRCFVYEKSKEPSGELKVAQSGDATCDGLLSPSEGSRNMVLRPSRHPQERCAFPEWLTTGRRWRSLDGEHLYEFGARNASLEVRSASSGSLALLLLCRREDTPTQWVVHATAGCENGYRCLKAYRRASHIVEVQLGEQTSHMSEACSSSHFDSTKVDLVILLKAQSGGELERSTCPLAGRFLLEGPEPQMSRLAWGHEPPPQACPERPVLSSGCAGGDRLELLLDCSPHKRVRSFQCHGSWEENGTYFLIASAMRSQRRYCIAFSENGKLVHFAESPQACVHNVPWLAKEPYVAFNLTSTGECQEGNAANRIRWCWIAWIPLAGLLWKSTNL